MKLLFCYLRRILPCQSSRLLPLEFQSDVAQSYYRLQKYKYKSIFMPINFSVINLIIR